MARRRYRRYYRRRSGRWAPNIQKIRDALGVTGEGEFSGNITLASNPVQTNTSVSQTYTVKNFEISFTIESSNSRFLENITVYVMYVPQGMTVGDDYYQQHPEYIMAYKYLGSPDIADTTAEYQQYQPFKVKSRMARKLQTGDQVVLFVQGTHASTESHVLNIDGLVRWWTKAN